MKHKDGLVNQKKPIVTRIGKYAYVPSLSLFPDTSASGIYKITNLVNGKIYVGSAAKSFHSRWQKHQSDLKLNKHRNQRLQKAFNKYGKQSFVYEILEVCNPESVLVREQHFIDLLNPFYNICKIAGNSKGVKRTAEFKSKLSKSRMGFKASDEFREKCRARMIGNSITKGMKFGPERREQIRLSLIGRKHSEETKQKMRLNNIGKVNSEEAKEKCRLSHLLFCYQIKNIHTNEIFETNNLKSFCTVHNLHDGCLNATYKGVTSNGRRSLQHKGFKMISKMSLQHENKAA